MFRVFNMGIGLALVIAPEAAGEILAALRAADVKGIPIGTVQKGGTGVVYDLGEDRVESR